MVQIVDGAGEYGIDLDVADMFEAQTIAALAHHLRGQAH